MQYTIIIIVYIIIIIIQCAILIIVITVLAHTELLTKLLHNYTNLTFGKCKQDLLNKVHNIRGTCTYLVVGVA